MARPQTQRNDGSTINSPRIPRGCLKFGKSKWDSDAMGPILFPFPKLPPGSQMGPIKRYAKGTHPSPKFNLPPGGSGRAPSVSRALQALQACGIAYPSRGDDLGGDLHTPQPVEAL